MTLSFASAASQVIALAAWPVAAGMYSAEEFAASALLSSALSVTSVAALSRLDNALLLSEDRAQAIIRREVCRRQSAAFSLLLVPFCALLFYIGAVGGWVFFLPVSTFLSVFLQLETCFAINAGHDSLAALAGFVRSAIYAACPLLLFSLGGEAALLISYPLSCAAGVAVLLTRDESVKVAKYALLRERRSMSGLSRWLLPGALFAQAAMSIQSFALSARADDGLVGAWGMASRITALPLAVIAAPAGQVLSQELSKADRELRNGLFMSFSRLLLAAAVLASAGLFMLSGLLPLILGADWTGASKLLQLSLPLFAVRLIVAPMSNTAAVLGQYKAVMLWQLSLFIISAVCAVMPLDAVLYIIVSQAALSLCYAAFFVLCRRMAAGEAKA